MNSPFEVHAFNGKRWTRVGERATMTEAEELAKEHSRGTHNAADIEQDGVRLAQFRDGKRT